MIVITKKTEEVVSEIQKIYPYIYYTKNTPGLGHDKNCIRTILYPTEKYVWYLGDSVIIKSGGIERVLSQIESYHPDFLSVNALGRVTNVRSKIYEDGNFFIA